LKNKTGKERDELLNTYPYYRFFTKKKEGEEGLKNSLNLREDRRFNGNIKFAELFPVKTKNRKDLEKLIGMDDKNFSDYRFEKNLREIIEDIEPALIIANSVIVSDLFSCDNKHVNETVLKYKFQSGAKVPLILSGKLTGKNGSDKYNKNRIIKQMANEIKECFNEDGLYE